jgi:hypothetical protein
MQVFDFSPILIKALMQSFSNTGKYLYRWNFLFLFSKPVFAG